MTTEKIKKEIVDALKQRKGNAPRGSEQPILENDVLTFAIAEGKNVNDVLMYHPESLDSNGETIKEYFTLATVDGRNVSQGRLFGRRGNGVPVDGETPDERMTNFLTSLADGKIVKLKAAKIRVLPSTIKGRRDQLIITWEKA